MSASNGASAGTSDVERYFQNELLEHLNGVGGWVNLADLPIPWRVEARNLVSTGRVVSSGDGASVRTPAGPPRPKNPLGALPELDKPNQKRFLEEKAIETLIALKASHAHFKVLVAALKYVDWKTGKTYISKAGLADRAGCDWKTVAAALQWAEEVGVIVDKQPRGDRYEYTLAPSLLGDF